MLGVGALDGNFIAKHVVPGGFECEGFLPEGGLARCMNDAVERNLERLGGAVFIESRRIAD